MIVGAALMGMWAPGLIGFPHLPARGLAAAAGCARRTVGAADDRHADRLPRPHRFRMLNSLGWAMDLVANHTLINRVLMIGWGHMFDAGYFWHYNELWVGGRGRARREVHGSSA